MRKCKLCGAEFESIEPSKAYCSPACSLESRRRHDIARYIKAHGSLTTKSCAYCGEEFTPKRRDSRYCSKVCNARYLRDNPTDYVSDPDHWQVTTPYGSHAFDGWVSKCLTGAAHA